MGLIVGESNNISNFYFFSTKGISAVIDLMYLKKRH